ncbi:nucleotide exchange factor GrpE, partial [Candidatus Saccharibacteria bacterium 32-49-10]
MDTHSKKPKKHIEKNPLEDKVKELTDDLQRTRADFENYRKNSDEARSSARTAGRTAAI